MSKHLKLLLFISSVVLVIGSPFQLIEEDTENFDAKKEAESLIYRLTENVIPLSYDLRIIPDLKKFIFVGNVEIETLIRFSSSKIELHSRQLTIRTCRLKKGSQLISSKFSLDPINELLIIETVEELAYNTAYTITIEFEGVLSDEMNGFYRSSYTINNEEYWLATTKFEPTFARKAFPCFDEPRFKTPFSIRLAHYVGQKVVSNMPSENVSPPDSTVDFRVWTIFKKTPPMATYLVSFMISDFASISDDSKKINVWTRKNAIQHAYYALKQSIKLLKHLEGYTGISYKLPKLDVVAIPDFKSGAMENWGMTTYRERYVILDESASSNVHKARLTQVICHEFSHMWFGDLVTLAWWDFTWLNEGFARYFEYFAANKVEPTWKLDQLFIVEQVQPALLNEIHKQRAMTTSVRKNDIHDVFDVISYAKGASIIRMFQHIFSSSTFRTALHNYLKTAYQQHHGTVVPADLYKAFDEQSYRESPPLPPRVSASDVMKTWTENIGYPLITVTRDAETGTVEIKQSTYKSSRASKPAPDQEWMVPLTFTTKSELKFTDTQPSMWSFANKTIKLQQEFSAHDWILFNIQHSGYYRVNYDSYNWNLLIKQLYNAPEKIHILNRAQLIDDSFALAYDEITCYHRSLKLAQYLTKETEIIPWLSALRHFNILFFSYEGLPVQGLLHTYLLNIIHKSYPTFGFNIGSTDSHLIKKGKPSFLLLACKIGVKDCINTALDEYSKNKNNHKKIQPDLKEVIYCAALRFSDDQQSVFDDIWNEYLKSNMAQDKTIILMSLSCVKNNQIIKKILSKIIDAKNKEIRKQDTAYVYNALFSNMYGLAASIEFVNEKLSTISDLDDTGISIFEEILTKIGNHVYLKGHVDMLDSLHAKFHQLDQKKYGSLTKIVHKAYMVGRKTAIKKIKKAKTLTHTLRELQDRDSPASTQTPTDIPAPSSAHSTTALFSKLRRSTAAIVALSCAFLLF